MKTSPVLVLKCIDLCSPPPPSIFCELSPPPHLFIASDSNVTKSNSKSNCLSYAHNGSYPDISATFKT